VIDLKQKIPTKKKHGPIQKLITTSQKS